MQACSEMWCCYMACSGFAGLTNLSTFRQRTITVRNHSHNYRMRAALTPWTSHLIRAYTRAWSVWEKAASHQRRRVLYPRQSPHISRSVLRGTHSKGNLLHRATPFRGERPLRAPGGCQRPFLPPPSHLRSRPTPGSKGAARPARSQAIRPAAPPTPRLVLTFIRRRLKSGHRREAHARGEARVSLASPGGMNERRAPSSPAPTPTRGGNTPPG